jgi:hypothetical protein
MSKSDPILPFAALMRDVCVGFGYCGCIKDGKPSHVDFFIPSEGTVTADKFVEWVFLAENLDPKMQPKADWKRLRRAFTQHMGADAVNASRLKR